MTCCILEKQITTTVIPGAPGVPATPGTPATPAYCATSTVNQCEWIENPAVTYRWELVPAYFDGLRWIPAHYENVPYVNGISILNGGNGTWLTRFVCHEVEVVNCYPAQAAIPGTAGIPPTPAQIITSKNLGWNSYSRAILPLDEDSILTFTVKAGVRGVFVGLAPAGVDGQRIRAFTHGMMIDASGVHVYERGVKGYQLAVSHNKLTAFQIARGYDGTITYRADASEYESLVLADGEDLYPYVYMYSGGDRVLCASYESVAMAGTLVGIEADLPAFRMVAGENGVNFFFVDADLVAMTAETECLEIEAITINEPLPYLRLVSSEAGVDYAFIDTDLPAATTAAEEAEYVPPALTEIYGNLAPIACFSFCLTVEMCDVDLALPGMEMVCGEGDYTFVNADMPVIGMYALEGVRLEMWMVDSMLAAAPMEMVRDTVMTIMSSGELVSVQTMDLIMVQEYMSTLQAESIQSLLGTYGLAYMSDLSVRSIQLFTLPAGASLNDLGRVWVVNLDTAAASQYDGYAFNSFFERGGKHYGVADDGIYLLEGSDDAGDAIQAAVELGLYDLGNSRHKSVPSIYLGVASAGKMLVKVVADGEAHVYEARSSSVDLKNHRVDTGRGLKGANWSFTVLNQDGGDFDLSSIEFLPLFMKRRI